MNPQQRNMVILGILAAAVAGVFYFNVLRGPAVPEVSEGQEGSPGTPGTAPGGARSVFEAQVINVDDLLASIKGVDFNYDENRLSRNPMMPLVGFTEQPAVPGGGKPGDTGVRDQGLIKALQNAKNMKVTGIMWDEKEPLAVVNDTVVGPGYDFGGEIVVESITRSAVVLKIGTEEIGTETVTLEMKEQ